MKSFTPKLLSCLLSVALAASPIPLQAGIESDMADMFNAMGGYANYTQGGTFHAQTANVYYGGSLVARFPNKNLTPMNIALPTVRGGCGGIDIFGGSFSFANKEQFVQFVRNLGNNAAGVAFEIALDSLDGLVGGAINKIRALVNQVNQTNLNSCQMAKQAVGGALGAVGQGMASACEASAVQDGTAQDGADSKWYCRVGANIATSAARVSGNDRNEKPIEFTGGNMMMQALERLDIPADEKDFVISLTGTYVKKPPKAGETPTLDLSFYAPTITRAADLLQGIGTGASGNTVKLTLLVCTDGTDEGSSGLKTHCAPQERTIRSMRSLVAERIQLLRSAIESNDKLSPADLQKVVALVENTPLPILKMVISDASMQTGLTTTKFMDVITLEYTVSWLHRMADVARRAAGMYLAKSLGESEKLENAMQNVNQLSRTIQGELGKAYAQASAEAALVQFMVQFDGQWRSTFPGIANAMDFESLNRLSGGQDELRILRLWQFRLSVPGV
ncbi:conjugal transfer protein TraH [Neisseriaceae bacterium TC5R-5]|nr:conjugal transfer protein TraH [Neisseriaceae bacterium TC5R-5]